jgi:hypothetical protein
MSSGVYFRRQAELCLQLAQLSEEKVASRLVQMAEDFDSRARSMEPRRTIAPQGWGSSPTRQP